MPPIFVVLYHPDTYAYVQTLPIAKRVSDLAAAIGRAAALSKMSPGELKGIFLAPEYYFTKPRTGISSSSEPETRQLDYGTVLELRKTLLQMSDENPNLFIVPGTMAWAKDLGVSKKTIVQDGLKEKRIARYAERALAIGGPFDKGAVEKAKQIQNAQYTAKNTAEVLFGGDLVFRYSKLADFHEVLGFDGSVVHIPGREVGRFSVAGYDFGISICADQNWESLDKGVPLQMTKDPVDFHILLSAFIEPKPSTVNLKSNGWLLSCSSEKSCTMVIGPKGPKPLMVLTSDLSNTVVML